MKKSEAIKRLQDYIDINAGSLEVPEQILNFVEGLGMIPPFSDKIFQRNARIHIDPSGREWEPEDEQNETQS
jgi:hypothetical protein